MDQISLAILFQTYRKHELVSYIPCYNNIFDDDDPKEQCYTASLIMQNLEKKKKIEDDQ